MGKHGIHNFTFSVIEICDVDIVEDRELFWIEYFNSTNRKLGYNLRKDKSGAMIVHESTRLKISERLKAEWSSGIRSGHSDKLKESWSNRDRKAQGKLFSKIKTKWKYKISNESLEKIVYYAELKELGLRGCLGKFAKYKTNLVYFKNFRIERIKIDT